MQLGMMVKRENNGNGEPVYKVFGLPVGTYFAPVAGTAIIGMIAWLVQLNNTTTYTNRVIAKVEAEQDERTAYFGKFVALESEVRRIAGVQENVISGNVVSIASLRSRLDQISTEHAAQKLSCERLWQRVDEIRRDIDRVIIRLNPNDDALRK